ncbi:MAG: hypothetical protein ACK5N9_23490, partial [Pirellula sp.]
DNEVRIFGSHQDIIGRLVDRTPQDGNIKLCNRAANAYDMVSQAFTFKGKTDRSAQKPDTNNANSLPNHIQTSPGTSRYRLTAVCTESPP